MNVRKIVFLLLAAAMLLCLAACGGAGSLAPQPSALSSVAAPGDMEISSEDGTLSYRISFLELVDSLPNGAAPLSTDITPEKYLMVSFDVTNISSRADETAQGDCFALGNFFDRDGDGQSALSLKPVYFETDVARPEGSGYFEYILPAACGSVQLSLGYPLNSLGIAMLKSDRLYLAYTLGDGQLIPVRLDSVELTAWEKPFVEDLVHRMVSEESTAVTYEEFSSAYDLKLVTLPELPERFKSTGAVYVHADPGGSDFVYLTRIWYDFTAQEAISLIQVYPLIYREGDLFNYSGCNEAGIPMSETHPWICYRANYDTVVDGFMVNTNIFTAEDVGADYCKALICSPAIMDDLA